MGLSSYAFFIHWSMHWMNWACLAWTNINVRPFRCIIYNTRVLFMTSWMSSCLQFENIKTETSIENIFLLEAAEILVTVFWFQDAIDLLPVPRQSTKDICHAGVFIKELRCQSLYVCRLARAVLHATASPELVFHGWERTLCKIAAGTWKTIQFLNMQKSTFKVMERNRITIFILTKTLRFCKNHKSTL